MTAPADMQALTLARAGVMSREQVDLIKRTICRGATDDELAMFVQAPAAVEALAHDEDAGVRYALAGSARELAPAVVEALAAGEVVDVLSLDGGRTSRESRPGS